MGSLPARSSFKCFAVGFCHPVDRVNRNPYCRQGFGVEQMDRTAIFYLFIHERLGEAGFVTFVVAVATVADDLDDHIPAEVLAVGESQSGDHVDRFRFLAIDMEDRDHQHLGDICGVAG